MKKKQIKKIMKLGKGNIYVTLILLLVIGIFTYYQQTFSSKDIVTLEKCTDGDTAHFYINGEDTTVRFLGIDTPETVKANTLEQPFGKEASNYTCNFLTSAKEIQIEYEESDKIDKYGRTLGWIFVDGILLQTQLVKEGLAEVKYLKDSYKYANELKAAEKEAQLNKRNIWADEN